MAGPTRGADESNAGSWRAAPGLARLVRVALFVAPLVVAWLAVQAVAPRFWQVEGGWAAPVFVLQALPLAMLTAHAADRVGRRLLPLATLLGLSLTFPDQAPSRFKVALRAGTVRKLTERLDEARTNGLSSDVNEAAEQAIELVTLLGRHERLTRGHTERVRAYSDMIGHQLGLSEHDRNLLSWSALLHDIGKLSVPAEILNKDGRPTDDEWKILSNHPAAGEDYVAPLADWLGDWRFATSQHHERWDGTGYPAKLAGADISLAGRIVAVADAYDVITSRRSYKAPMSAETARRELVACSGTQFDPDMVRAMLQASLSDATGGHRTGTLSQVPEVGRLLAGSFGAGGLTSLAGAALGGVFAVAATLFGAVNGIGAMPDGLAFFGDETVTVTATPGDPDATVGADGDTASDSETDDEVTIDGETALDDHRGQDELDGDVAGEPGGGDERSPSTTVPGAPPSGPSPTPSTTVPAGPEVPPTSAGGVLDPVLDPVLDDILDPVIDDVLDPILDPLDPLTDPLVDDVLDPLTEGVTDPILDPVLDPLADDVLDDVLDDLFGTNGGSGSPTTTQPPLIPGLPGLGL